MIDISIVIATYNAEKYLQQCLDSVKANKSENIELIIIDGKSNDNTIHIIKENEQDIDFWISEKDDGIYDAWNKGVKNARGTWIMFLGADDELLPGAIKKYHAFIENHNQCFDLISSRIQMIDLKGNKIRVIGYPHKWPQFLRSMLIAHPGALHAKRLFETYGLFDTDYKIVGDYEFLLRIGAKLKTGFLPEITVVMREGGASDSTRAVWEAQKAANQTGGYNKALSIWNACYVITKFRIKKLARKIGMNAYLKR